MDWYGAWAIRSSILRSLTAAAIRLAASKQQTDRPPLAEGDGLSVCDISRLSEDGQASPDA
ncbi:hypothetical protein NZD89_21255 [Alicyclobacillus fastidiosus]|uniref:Uncharacterized protein n=1 Tax=Alicyclobacillus fastidiosus TaxID=392011 RepID=A0ABY6ZF75_9BACL|nr:hypothetical protein [Alicyclobacillus fastidiosus]WAH40799.1 hypothetical protein NZD89_21255 [Alicyclobacillus fastidiosus]